MIHTDWNNTINLAHLLAKRLVNNGFGVYLINFNTKKRTRINQADTPTSNASTLYIESFNMKKMIDTEQN